MWIAVWALVSWVISFFVDNADKWAVLLGTPITIEIWLISKYNFAFRKIIYDKYGYSTTKHIIEDERFALISWTCANFGFFFLAWWLIWLP